jgi:hypothetical protein
MPTTPLPLVAVLALGCVGVYKDDPIPPMMPPHSGDTGTLVPPMTLPGPTGDTGATVAPMPPPETGDTGALTPPMPYPVTAGPAPAPPGLSPLPATPLARSPR